MAVAYDNHTTAGDTGFATSYTVNHTPTGTPRGILAMCTVGPATADELISATYGGTAMTLVGSNVLGSGESHNVAVYFLGASVPTGAQDFVISLDAALRSHITVISLTADNDVEVVDFDDTTINSETYDGSADATLSLSGRTCFAALQLATGAGATTAIAPNSGWGTTIGAGTDEEFDFGPSGAATYSYDTVGTADITTAGWDQASDDGQMVAVAVAELDSGVVIPQTSLSGLGGYGANSLNGLLQ